MEYVSWRDFYEQRHKSHAMLLFPQQAHNILHQVHGLLLRRLFLPRQQHLHQVGLPLADRHDLSITDRMESKLIRRHHRVADHLPRSPRYRVGGDKRDRIAVVIDGFHLPGLDTSDEFVGILLRASIELVVGNQSRASIEFVGRNLPSANIEFVGSQLRHSDLHAFATLIVLHIRMAFHHLADLILQRMVNMVRHPALL